MRVLHVEAGRHLYGGAAQVGLLLDALDRQGLENLLVCPPEQPLAAGVRAPISMRGDLDARLAGRLLGRIRAFRPDIVHVHSRRGADLYGGIAAAMARVPAVVTRRVESREPGPWLRIKLKRYAKVVAISRAVESELRGAGIDTLRVERIPSAVDTARWRPDAAAAGRLRKAFHIPADAPVAVCVAQFIPRKGHRTLLAALAALPVRHRRLRLVCFGRGPEESALRREIASTALVDRVAFAGFREDLASLLPGADVLIHPAEREGLGVALLEAMSAGVPVVAAEVGGIPDLIRNDVDGVLVTPGDPVGLAGAVTGLLDDDGRRAAFGAAARRRVESAFSVPAMTSAYLDLYRRVTGGDDAHGRH